MVAIEKSSYKQQIKSKTTFTETNVITVSQLLPLIYSYTSYKLSQEDLKELQECV